MGTRRGKGAAKVAQIGPGVKGPTGDVEKGAQGISEDLGVHDFTPSDPSFSTGV